MRKKILLDDLQIARRRTPIISMDIADENGEDDCDDDSDVLHDVLPLFIVSVITQLQDKQRKRACQVLISTKETPEDKSNESETGNKTNTSQSWMSIGKSKKVCININWHCVLLLVGASIHQDLLLQILHQTILPNLDFPYHRQLANGVVHPHCSNQA